MRTDSASIFVVPGASVRLVERTIAAGPVWSTIGIDRINTLNRAKILPAEVADVLQGCGIAMDADLFALLNAYPKVIPHVFHNDR